MTVTKTAGTKRTPQRLPSQPASSPCGRHAADNKPSALATLLSPNHPTFTTPSTERSQLLSLIHSYSIAQSESFAHHYCPSIIMASDPSGSGPPSGPPGGPPGRRDSIFEKSWQNVKDFSRRMSRPQHAAPTTFTMLPPAVAHTQSDEAQGTGSGVQNSVSQYPSPPRGFIRLCEP
jgi:hypothetical protein